MMDEQEVTNVEELGIILNSNLSNEQKDVLLDLFSKKLIEERNAKNEKSKYTTTREEREKKIEEINRKHALKEKSKVFSSDILFMRDVLSWVRNSQGERIYKDIKCDTQAEIKEVCDLYEMYEEKSPEVLEKALHEFEDSKKEKLIAKGAPEKKEADTKKNTEEKNIITNLEFDNEKVDAIDSSAKLKPEKPKKVKNKKTASSVISKKIDFSAYKPLLAVAGILAATTLLLTNPTLLLTAGVGLGGWVANEYKKGKSL